MRNELARVNFHGDTLVATENTDGSIRVGFRQLCNVMGLNYTKQLRELRTRSWATIEQVPMLMLEDELIRHMMEVGPGDRPCISLGLTYSHHRRKALGLGDAMGEAPIYLPDRAMVVPVKVYSGAELHQFKVWLQFTYLPEK